MGPNNQVTILGVVSNRFFFVEDSERLVFQMPLFHLFFHFRFHPFQVKTHHLTYSSKAKVSGLGQTTVACTRWARNLQIRRGLCVFNGFQSYSSGFQVSNPNRLETPLTAFQLESGLDFI